MLKKTLGYVLKTCWIIAVFLIPTLIITTYNFRFKSLIFLYVSSILLVGVVSFVVLSIWKKPYSLFALSIGFLMTVISNPLPFFLIGGPLWHFYSGFFAKETIIILWGIIYSLPFSILYFLPTIPAIIRWHKKRRQPIAADKTDDSRESEVTDETVR